MVALKQYLASGLTITGLFAVVVIGASSYAAQLVKGEQSKPAVTVQANPSTRPVTARSGSSSSAHRRHSDKLRG